MDKNEFQKLGAEASKDALAEAGSWLRTCHFAWLWAGVFSGWVLDLAMNAALSIFNFIPVIGPLIVDTILGPVDEIIVAVIPLMSLRELIRRWKSRKRAEDG